MSTTPAQPTRLHLLTMPKHEPAPACTGGYLCECPACHAERAEHVKRGPRPRRRDQPWANRAA